MTESVRLMLRYENLSMLASTSVGLTVLCYSGQLAWLYHEQCRRGAPAWDLEEQRRCKLRRNVWFYRLMEPLIHSFSASQMAEYLPLDKIALWLNRGGASLPWVPREFAGVLLATTLVGELFVLLFCSVYLSIAQTALLTAVTPIAVVGLSLRSLSLQANEKLHAVLRRLPFAVDLAAVAIGAGATTRESLQVVANDSPEHPLSAEFRKILCDMENGKSFRQCLDDLDQRLSTSEIREVVNSLQKAEDLGMPINRAFSELADQMRLRKSQAVDGEIQRGRVRIEGPATLVLLACMIACVAPFIFEVLRTSESIH